MDLRDGRLVKTGWENLGEVRVGSCTDSIKPEGSVMPKTSDCCYRPSVYANFSGKDLLICLLLKSSFRAGETRPDSRITLVGGNLSTLKNICFS